MGLLSRWQKILSQEGVKQVLKLVLSKLEYVVRDMLGSGVIVICKFLPDKSVDKQSCRILILMEDRFSVSSLNRVHDLAEYLKMAGFSVVVASPWKYFLEFCRLCKYSVVVIQRGGRSKILEAICNKAQSSGIKLVYDCDDLMFDTDSVEYMHDNVGTDITWWTRKVNSYNYILKKCDFFLTTTEYLAQTAEKLGKETFIIRNGLNNRFIQESKNVFLNKDVSRIILGYMSGTNTHNRDFESISGVLATILRENPKVRLKIIGPMDLVPELEAFDARVIRISKVSFWKLPQAMSDFDINLGPLVLQNPFNESKSELRYMYAGLQKIPTIVSPTCAFRFAIKNGINGYLAQDDDEWLMILRLLVKNSVKRRLVGEKAYEHIEKTYFPEVMSMRVKSVFESILSKDTKLETRK